VKFERPSEEHRRKSQLNFFNINMRSKIIKMSVFIYSLFLIQIHKNKNNLFFSMNFDIQTIWFLRKLFLFQDSFSKSKKKTQTLFKTSEFFPEGFPFFWNEFDIDFEGSLKVFSSCRISKEEFVEIREILYGWGKNRKNEFQT